MVSSETAFCPCIYRSVINISGLFHIYESLFVEVVKIMHRPRICRFLPQQFVPVESVPLWDAAGCAGGDRVMACVWCAAGLCDVCGQMLRVSVVRHSLEVCSVL